jgi:hypothetical protein
MDKVIRQSKERLTGNNMWAFTCQSFINEVEKVYELKYEIDTCKWYYSKCKALGILIQVLIFLPKFTNVAGKSRFMSNLYILGGDLDSIL